MSKKLEDYRIPGTNVVSWSAYSRENIPKEPHKIPLGQVVSVKISHIYDRVVCSGNYIELRGRARLYVVGHHFDCDGTALYILAAKAIAPPDDFSSRMKWESVVRLWFNGYDEESMKPIAGVSDTVISWQQFCRIMAG
jgi:hypothetical protein